MSCGTPPDDPHATESAEEGRAGEEDIVYTCDEGYVIHTAALGGFSGVRANNISCLDAATHTDRVPCTAACAVGTQYSNPVGECMACTLPCNYGGGEYQPRGCGGFEDRVCRSCESGTYRAERASTSCTACGLTCQAGQRISGDCLRRAIVSDPLSCAACAAGKFVGGAVTATTGSDRCADCGRGLVCPADTRTFATVQVICGAIAEYMDEPQGTVCSSADDGQFTVTASGAPNTANVPHVRQLPCSVGHRCSGGVQTACSSAGAQFQDAPAQSSCTPVDEGYYSTPEGVRQLRHDFWPFVAHFSAPPHPTHAVCCGVLSEHVVRVLLGAWNPILCPIRGFRPTSGRGSGAASSGTPTLTLFWAIFHLS